MQFEMSSLGHGDSNSTSKSLSLKTKFSFETSIIWMLFPLLKKGKRRQAIEWSSSYMNFCDYSNFRISLLTTNSFNSFKGFMLLNILTFLSYIRISYTPH